MMAITVPVDGDLISANGFGAPVANQVNTNTAFIAGITPTTWTTATLTSPWTHYGSSPVQYRKVGDMVQVRGRCDGSGPAFAGIFTLPVGFRPVVQTMVACPCVVGGAWVTGVLIVETTGVINTGSAASSWGPNINISITA